MPVYLFILPAGPLQTVVIRSQGMAHNVVIRIHRLQLLLQYSPKDIYWKKFTQHNLSNSKFIHFSTSTISRINTRCAISDCAYIRFIKTYVIWRRQPFYINVKFHTISDCAKIAHKFSRLYVRSWIHRQINNLSRLNVVCFPVELRCVLCAFVYLWMCIHGLAYSKWTTCPSLV